MTLGFATDGFYNNDVAHDGFYDADGVVVIVIDETVSSVVPALVVGRYGADLEIRPFGFSFFVSPPSIPELLVGMFRQFSWADRPIRPELHVARLAPSIEVERTQPEAPQPADVAPGLLVFPFKPEME